MKYLEVIGKQFNNLTPTTFIGSVYGNHKYYICKCICGNETKAIYQQLINGTKKSCGCDRKGINTTHRMSKTRFYRIYHSILRRCNEQSCLSYKRYGGRGIKCLREKFEDFKNDMYESYCEHTTAYGASETSIDRIDNNGDYCKDNCRRATYKEQANNTSQVKTITINGVTKCQSDRLKHFKVSPGAFRSRLEGGREFFKALTTPSRKR